MPGWLNGRRVVWLGLGLVVALVVFMPMRVALGIAGLGDRGLTARSVVGTVWYGELADARFGDIALGNLRAGLSPLHLLTGETRIGVHGTAVAGIEPLDGAVVAGASGTGIVGMSGTVPVGQVFAPLPIASIRFADATIRFRDGACATASGRVEALLAAGLDGVPGLALPRSVSGVAHCDAGKLILPLTSQSGTEAITLSIAGDGRYHADLSVRPDDAAIAEKLRLAGFVEGPRGDRLSVEGHF